MGKKEEASNFTKIMNFCRIYLEKSESEKSESLATFFKENVKNGQI